MLQLAVQSCTKELVEKHLLVSKMFFIFTEAPFVLVIGQQRCQLVDLVEGGSGSDGETISAIVIVINDPYK